jgi:multicomponent Na+:H+ antiporter subunit E
MTRPESRSVAPVIWRLVLFAAGWLVLTGDIASVGPIGAAVVALAAAASLWLQPPGSLRWHAAGLVRFVPYFLSQSWRGGLDVAARALLARRPLAPGLVDYRVSLPEGPARRFFAAAIGLLPGTLTTELEGDRLTVHALDRRLPVATMLQELEDRTAALFGVPPR